MEANPKRSPHVMVSGGSRGLGRCLVEALLREDYVVSTFSRSETEFTRGLVGNERFMFERADASDATSLQRFVSAAVERLGVPFGLVNCAGQAVEGVLPAMPSEQIDGVLATNLGGALHLTRAVLRKMLVQKTGGSIVNISSIIGLRGYSGLAAYAATKGGMDAMTRSLARELGPRGIRVNSVAPGYLETEMTHGLDDVQHQQIVRRTPLGRLGRPEDVVGTVRFLLSDASRFVTGQVIAVDGGITC
ncbi:MAG TPA: SDR family oxidoreductase [Anaeromyxobacter sp.]